MSSVAYLGPRGTNTHRAALKIAAEEKLIPFPSVPLLTAALDKGEITQAVLPLENSLEGTVSTTFDYLTSTLKRITAEVVLDIKHVLVSKNITTIENIKFIASHPQALAQCSVFINNAKLQTLPTASTAGAVEKLSDDTAAIVPPLAAEIYGLAILAENISDTDTNSTRFCFLSDIIPPPTGNDKTSILFEIADRPGSLFEILRLFTEAQINLSKIESRPAKYRLGKYLFAIDFEGHVYDEKTSQLLNLLKRQCIWLKILGSYPKAGY